MTTRRAPARKSGGRAQTIRIVVEQAATTQVGRPDITPAALTGAQVESKRGRAKL